MLDWRLYRDKNQSFAPVLRAEARVSYAWEPYVFPASERIYVGPYTSAVYVESGERVPALDTGHLFQRAPDSTNVESLTSRKTEIRDSLLARGPVLLSGVADTGGRLRSLAQWQKRTTNFDRNLYTMPQLADDQHAIIVPYTDQAGDNRDLSMQAEPMGQGCFRIGRGFPIIRAVHVNGAIWDGHQDYDPYWGVVYIERADGTPAADGADVRVTVSTSTVWRIELAALAPGEHIITDDGLPTGRGEVLGTVHKHDESIWHDARRLPYPDGDGIRSAVDFGQMDGSVVPRGTLWIIKTDADPTEVEKAVRRTLPVGTIYRIEPLT